MKSGIKWFSFAASLLLMAALEGCSTTSSQPTAEGTSSALAWPDPAHAWPGEGTFPNVENLRMLGPGMTKDQLYALVGRPHFNEGMAGVREWDYLFNFRTGKPAPNDVARCQMKVLFDQDMLSRSTFWAPESCADFSRAPASPPVQLALPLPEKTVTLSADALFDFDGWSMAHMLPEGRQPVVALGRALAGMKSLNHVDVDAYTDRLGSGTYNTSLSQRRADTVKALLVEQGVNANLVRATGFGEAASLSRCGAMPRARLISCLAPDRRVEIRTSGVK